MIERMPTWLLVRLLNRFDARRRKIALRTIRYRAIKARKHG